jgi:hypothetical protein
LEYILHNAVSALLECENVSLLGINRMLIDPSYRQWVIRQIKDPFIRAFWEVEYAGYDARFQREAIAPIQNKVGQFLLSPPIRNILGQVRNRLSFPFIMDGGRIFIANLSKGSVGEDKANLLGSLLASQFQAAAMTRAKRPEHERRDFHLLIDEFQNFSTTSFASLLAESRKYRLCLTLAHQYVDQLSLPVRQAVFGNVGTLMALRVGHADAEILEKEFGKSFSAKTLADLDRYEAVVKVLENGANTQPFRSRTLPPMLRIKRRARTLLTRSRQRYTASRSVVEARLNRWMRTPKGRDSAKTIKSSA